MVVVSGSWVKNVATYPTPANNIDMVIPTNNTMSAKAILTCRPNSHPFQERTLTLDQPTKIGRSVARARPTPTNAIFDCKVLSRHHALLWYDNGKFFLQDTKSSNGTFVNNNKLSTSESEPHEVSSGDIVQFGVDVVENNRRVTHCCIVATLKLYLADGKEAKASPSVTETNRHGLVPLDELYKLNQIIQEACQREQCLEHKLSALQQAVEETRKVTDESWQAYIGEERLLSRVATLESQLAKSNKNISDDRLREELHKLQEEKIAYQLTAKESLSKLHADHLEAIATASQQERAKVTAEQEASLAKDQLFQAQKELEDIVLKLSMEQKRAKEDKANSEQREQELQATLDFETQEVNELRNKLEQFRSLVNNPIKEDLEKSNLIYTDDDVDIKEEMLKNEIQSNNCDDPQENHFNTNSTMLDDDEQDTDCEYETNGNESLTANEQWTSVSRENSGTNKVYRANGNEVSEKECESVFAKENSEHLKGENGDEVDDHDDDDDSECTEKETIKIDSKTLKFQFQSLESDLKRQIDQLQQQSVANINKILDLERSLTEEKRILCSKSEECDQLQIELLVLNEKWRKSCQQIEQMNDIVASLRNKQADSDVNLNIKSDLSDRTEVISTISNTSLSAEQVGALEEELVTLKERYAAVNEDKLKLNKSLITLQDKYNALCNQSHNTMFFYIAPLVLLVLYLLINRYFS